MKKLGAEEEAELQEGFQVWGLEQIPIDTKWVEMTERKARGTGTPGGMFHLRETNP